jgi:hypothetical protein
VRFIAKSNLFNLKYRGGYAIKQKDVIYYLELFEISLIEFSEFWLTAKKFGLCVGC